MKKTAQLIGLFMLTIIIASAMFMGCDSVKTIEDFTDTAAYVQYITETTREQAECIVALLEENNIVCKEIEWSEINGILENRNIFEYYNIFDVGKTYILTLAIHNEQTYKQIYKLSNRTDNVVLYVNEDLYPKRPSSL